jgi:hypothetical protein
MVQKEVIQDVVWLRVPARKEERSSEEAVALHTSSRNVVSNELASMMASSEIGSLSMRA